MRFEGWPPDALAFFRELEQDANNTREWWHANKHRYEEAVRAPLEALLDELHDEWGDAKVFRPHRDTRFSKDKRPYKTAIGAITQRGTYVQLGADELWAGGGMYEPTREQLAAVRAALDDERRARRFTELAAELEAQGLPVQGSELTTAPRGWSADHPQVRWLRHKRFYVLRRWEPEPWLHTQEALTRVRDAWTAASPLCAWLQETAGAPRAPHRATR